MAKRKGESTRGYFVKLLSAHPDWLNAEKNKEILERWSKDHPGNKTVPASVKQGLANVKSSMRKLARTGKLSSPGRSAPVQLTKSANPSVRSLEALEERIDDVLSLAKSLGHEGLYSVIKSLLHARRQVVWQMGGPDA